MPHRHQCLFPAWLVVAFCVSAIPAAAQQTRSGYDRHYVYDQYVPPGVAGQMHLQAGTLRPHVPQQVRITLPQAGTVTFFDGGLNRPVSTAAPAQAAMLTGVMYRLQVSGMERFPHTDFFPSIELISELHPPPGQAERFPIEIELLEEELEQAERGRMVTKVVYLEQPDRVPLRNLQGTPRVVDLEVGQNAIAEADQLGRPIAIVRLGGRTPNPYAADMDRQFWGPLPPVRLTARAAAPEPMTRQTIPPAHRAPVVSGPQRPFDSLPAAFSTPGPSLR